jgi:glycosyltransferase involved in cell wall biosynthesis
LALSKASKEELISFGLPPEKVKVFRYWIDLGKFKPLDKEACKKSLSLSKKFVVLFVGRLIEVKGVRLIIEAARSLSHVEDIVFVIIGEGPLQGYVIHESLKWRNIKYLGGIRNEQLPLYYNAADIVIVPSAYEEGYGRVILEALACGAPVVASNRGGIPEALSESVGVLIEPRVDEIVRTIKQLYENPTKLNSLKNECRPYAESMFSERNVEMIAKEYEYVTRFVEKR